MHFTFVTSFGRITLEEENHVVSRLYFANRSPNYSTSERPSLFLRQAAWEIREYLEGRSCDLYVPAAPVGMPTLRVIWERIRRIEYGKTVTAGDIVRMLGNRITVRAVVSACRRNPIPIVIPTHRVIGVGDNLDELVEGSWTLRNRLLALEGGALKVQSHEYN